MALNKMLSYLHPPKYVQAAILMSFGGILFGYVSLRRSLHYFTLLFLELANILPKTRHGYDWAFDSNASIYYHIWAPLLHRPRSRRLYYPHPGRYILLLWRPHCEFDGEIESRCFGSCGVWTRGGN